MYAEACACEKEGDCYAMVWPDCVHVIARKGTVEMLPCSCGSGHTWHLDKTCLICGEKLGTSG